MLIIPWEAVSIQSPTNISKFTDMVSFSFQHASLIFLIITSVKQAHVPATKLHSRSKTVACRILKILLLKKERQGKFDAICELNFFCRYLFVLQRFLYGFSAGFPNHSKLKNVSNFNSTWIEIPNENLLGLMWLSSLLKYFCTTKLLRKLFQCFKQYLHIFTIFGNY